MLTVMRGGSGQPSEVATGTFTGTAWRDVGMGATDGVAVGNVFFEPCSRTYWHSHVGGQLLVAIAGEGVVATEDETVVLRAGDSVWTPPGVRHWHGGGAGRYLLHTAVTVGDTDWQDAVTDAEYADATGATGDAS